MTRGWNNVIIGAAILGVVVLAVAVIGSGTVRRRWIEFPGTVRTGEPVGMEGGWYKLPILRGSRGKIFLPDGTFLADVSGVVDGICTLYHTEGPLKGLKAAEYPYVRGRISGIATFWDDYGRVVRQERWSAARPIGSDRTWRPREEDVAEVRTAPPWWGGVKDQVPPDGVYTKLDSSFLMGAGQQFSVVEQWRYAGGAIAERRTSAPWLDPDPSLWQQVSGEIVFFPGAGDERYVLDGRPVPDGQELKLRDGPRVRVEFEDNGASPRLVFILAESVGDVPAGTPVELQPGAHLEWPAR